APADGDGDEPRLRAQVAQVRVPGKGHEDIRTDEQQDGFRDNGHGQSAPRKRRSYGVGRSLDPNAENSHILALFIHVDFVTDITFGPFSIDTSGSRLIRNGAEVKLRPQAVCALKALALHSGRYIGYEQMIAEAWAGTSVSKHTVDVTIG